MMQSHDVLEIVQQLELAGVAVWLDGGWGVDALIGQQTRPHDDVDVIISLDQASLAEEALRPAGYGLAEDERPTRFVLRDSRGRSIDFHLVIFDRQGDGVQQLPDGTTFHYPCEGFTGKGQIGNCSVPCITAETQVLCHVGYEPDENDLHDMQHLYKHFQVEIPLSYHQHLSNASESNQMSGK